MNNGTISDNISSSDGGGVFASSFTMSGGTISGNTTATIHSNNRGGGVYIGGTFTKQVGGVIYGSNESNNALRNVAFGGEGHAVYVGGSSPAKKRNTTAGTGVAMDSTKGGPTGGWE
jgi:hypothetical protein